MVSFFHVYCYFFFYSFNDGVGFSIELLEWGRKFSDFGVSKDSKWEDSRLKKSESCCLLNLIISKLTLTALHSAT